MPGEGLGPSIPIGPRILSPVRIPIPPPGQVTSIIILEKIFVNQLPTLEKINHFCYNLTNWQPPRLLQGNAPCPKSKRERWSTGRKAATASSDLMTTTETAICSSTLGRNERSSRDVAAPSSRAPNVSSVTRSRVTVSSSSALPATTARVRRPAPGHLKRSGPSWPARLTIAFASHQEGVTPPPRPRKPRGLLYYQKRARNLEPV